jgi:diguanylate cyclase (GGDEF)-like protein
VTRFGGEEFALVAMETDRSAALETARRICAEMARTPIQTGSVTLPVTVSAGLAVLPGDATDGKALIAAADKALYAAKAAGRNRAMAFADL